MEGTRGKKTDTAKERQGGRGTCRFDGLQGIGAAFRPWEQEKKQRGKRGVQLEGSPEKKDCQHKLKGGRREKKPKGKAKVTLGGGGSE